MSIPNASIVGGPDSARIRICRSLGSDVRVIGFLTGCNMDPVMVVITGVVGVAVAIKLWLQTREQRDDIYRMYDVPMSTPAKF